MVWTIARAYCLPSLLVLSLVLKYMTCQDMVHSKDTIIFYESNHLKIFNRQLNNVQIETVAGDCSIAYIFW